MTEIIKAETCELVASGELVRSATSAGVFADEELVGLWVADQRSLATQKSYRRIADRLLMFLRVHLCNFSPLILGVAEPADIKAFEASLKADEKADGTVATMMAVCRSLYRFAERTRHIDWSPAHAFKLKQRDATPAAKALTEDEIVRIFNNAASDWHRTLLDFLYASGARAGETANLTWQRIEFVDGHAHVTFVGKGNKVRVIQLPKKISSKLLKLRGNETVPADPVFTRGRRDENGLLLPIAVETIRDTLHEACYRAGITRKVSPHWLRRSYGTHADRQGASLTAIQDALGHADPRTTRRYVQAHHGVMLSADFITERD